MVESCGNQDGSLRLIMQGPRWLLSSPRLTDRDTDALPEAQTHRFQQLRTKILKSVVKNFNPGAELKGCHFDVF